MSTLMSDHFSLEFAFPDAEALFKNKFENLDVIKENCLITLDTNILLAPYGFNQSSVEKLRSVYSRLLETKSIFLTGRVVREYARARGSKIRDLIQEIRNQSSRVVPPEIRIEFLASDPDYIKAIEASADIVQAKKSVNSALSDIVQKLQEWHRGDTIWNLYCELFHECIVDLPIDANTTNALVEEMKFRYKNEIPPGYKDKGKNDGGIGDLVIWKTILKKAESEESKRHMIFVTGEEKSDWFIRMEGSLFPRFELIDEYRRHSKGGTIHIVNFTSFLKLYNAPESVVAASIKLEKENEIITPSLLENNVKNESQSDLEIQLASLHARVRDVRDTLTKVYRKNPNDLIRETIIDNLNFELNNLNSQISALRSEHKIEKINENS